MGNWENIILSFPRPWTMFAMMLTVMSLALCEQAHAVQTAHRIEGFVKDQTGAPVSSAEVILTGKSSTKQITDNEGRFPFDLTAGILEMARPFPNALRH